MGPVKGLSRGSSPQACDGWVSKSLKGQAAIARPMAEPAPPVIQARGLVKKYGSFKALGPMTMNVPHGAVGLLGPNGAGKSTLIKTLLGLVPVTEGAATVLGMRVGDQNLDIRQRVGYMPEMDAQIIHMSGFQYVAYAGELAGMPRRDAIQRAHEMLNYVGLDEERYRPVEQYSTGMRQRAKLAQAIVHDPQLVFLDEPTNGLDPKGREEMLDLIRDLAHKRGVGVILSSHLLPDVEYVCESVVVLKEGTVAAAGSIGSLKQHDENRYEVRVKGEGAAFVRALQRLGCTVRDSENGMFVVTLPKGKTSQLILQIAHRAKIQLRHLNPTRSTLEDVFLQTVGAS